MLTASGVKHAIQQFTDDVVILFKPLVTLISVSRQIDLDKIGINVEALPKKSKKVWVVNILSECFEKDLNQYRTRVRSAVTRACAMCEFGGITSRDRGLALSREIEQITQEFNETISKCTETEYERMCLAARHDVIKEATEQGLKGNQIDLLDKAIASKQPSYSNVMRKLRFTCYTQPINLSSEDFDPSFYEIQKNSMVAIRDSVMGEMIRELCETALDVVNRLNCQRNSKGNTGLIVHSKTVKRIATLLEKIEDLSFVHKHLRSLTIELTKLSTALGCKTEALRENEFDNFVYLVTFLTNQHHVISCLENNRPIFEYVDEGQVVVDEGGIPPLISDYDIPDDDGRDYDYDFAMM